MNSFKNNSATIAQVAAAAHVSKTTVSRYLNGKFEFMSAETKEEIERVIEELDYHPSNIARSLKSQKSKLLGCVVADISSPFSSVLIKGVNDVCAENGYQVLFSNTDDRPDRELSSIQQLISSRVDGLIVNTTSYNDDYLIDLAQKGMPIVLADRCLGKSSLIDTITTENTGPTYACMRHLYQNGYEKVAFFTPGNGSISSRVERHDAFLKAMRDFYGVDGSGDTYLIDADDPSVCLHSLEAFIDANPGKRLAIFCVNGVTLLNVLRGMQKAGYPISSKLGICGFDDWGWASLIPPGITTITQDSYTVGKLSAQTVLKHIKSKRDSEVVYVALPNQLIIRGSTNPAAAGIISGKGEM